MLLLLPKGASHLLRALGRKVGLFSGAASELRGRQLASSADSWWLPLPSAALLDSGSLLLPQS